LRHWIFCLALSTVRLTRVRQQRSLTSRSMRSSAQRRKRSWQSASVSLAVLLALIVAPTCAPLCAAQVCSQAPASAASEGHCHFAAAAPHKVSQVHRLGNCGASELPPAALTSVSGSEALLTFRSAASASSPCAFSQELPELPVHHGVRRCAEPHASPYSHSSLATSVLRI
jgi:hypothetical protein